MRLKTYGKDTTLFLDQVDLDSLQMNNSRQVMGLFEVIGNVGGI